MTDPKTEDRSGEMENDLHALEGHIADAEKKLEGPKKAAGVGDEVAGDREGEQHRGGGDDPKGAAQDAGDDPKGAAEDAGDDDERVDEEMANPT